MRESSATPWAPLQFATYRSFWIAGLVSNLGTWMHETGAQWLMTSLDGSPQMVAAVRTVMTVPVFVLALPAGVWADRIDRRRWLLGTQTILAITAVGMTVLAATELMTPTVLLLLTAAMGIGMVLNQPAWQSMTPELVPPALIPAAVSIGSFSFNLARTVGPALAGFLIAQFDVWVAFALNACSFLAVIAVLYRWQPSPHRASVPGTSFASELQQGLATAMAVVEVRHTLIRLFCFSLPASVLWSLLALVATEKLEFAERGFGLSLALVGSGAVAGAWVITYLRARFSSEQILLTVQCVYGTLCVMVGVSDSRFLLLPVLILIGCCWMSVMTTLNATAQVFLPRHIRARGMAAYLMAFALGTAVGSVVWGWVARWTSLDGAYLLAGFSMLLVAALSRQLPLGDLRRPREQ